MKPRHDWKLRRVPEVDFPCHWIAECSVCGIGYVEPDTKYPDCRTQREEHSMKKGTPARERGFGHGKRKVGYKQPVHGAVVTLYSRDFPSIAGSITCARCKAIFRDSPQCPNCLDPVKSNNSNGNIKLKPKLQM